MAEITQRDIDDAEKDWQAYLAWLAEATDTFISPEPIIAEVAE